jgi:hypothetical protein
VSIAIGALTKFPWVKGRYGNITSGSKLDKVEACWGQSDMLGHSKPASMPAIISELAVDGFSSTL